jgi:hypothetical protein
MILSLSSLLILATCNAFVYAQDPGPSPTASVGCVAHGDHWDCEGPRTPENAITSYVSSVNPGPSPTGSVGCKPHGDHWDCEAPRTAPEGVVAAPAPTATKGSESHAHEDEHEDGHEGEHEDGHAESGKLGPSPIESIGCVPHGDHWDCQGPRATEASITTAPSASSNSSGAAGPTATIAAPPVPFEGAAGSNGAQLLVLAIATVFVFAFAL